MPAYDAVQPGGRGRPRQVAHVRCACGSSGTAVCGAGCEAREQGAGKGRVGADVDYAQEDWLD